MKFKVGDTVRYTKDNSDGGTIRTIVKIEGNWAYAYWCEHPNNADLLGGIHFSDLELVNDNRCVCKKCPTCE